MHRRPYRETSSLVQFWVAELGLVSAVVKGVHGSGKAATLRNAWLQPFLQLEILIYGQRELKQVYKFEPKEQQRQGSPAFLLAGQYLNELLLLSLRKYDLEFEVFQMYSELLDQLRQVHLAPGTNRTTAALLRSFEQHLLLACGFAVDWRQDVSGSALVPDGRYRFAAGEGFHACEEGALTGRLLDAAGEHRWSVAGALGTARHVLQRQLDWCVRQLPPVAATKSYSVSVRTRTVGASSLSTRD